VLVTVIEQHHGPVVLRLSAEACQHLPQIAGVHADVIQTGRQVVAQAELVRIATTLQSNVQQVWAWADLVLLE
jgi:hypothetical protein